MLSICANASSQPWPPLFSGFINDTLLQLSADTGAASDHRCPELLSDRRVLVSAPRSYSQLNWGLVNSLARHLVQWSLGFHVVAAWWCPVHGVQMCCCICDFQVSADSTKLVLSSNEICLHCFMKNLFKKQSAKFVQNPSTFTKVMAKHILVCFYAPQCRCRLCAVLAV